MVGLTVVGAVLLMVGVITVLVSEAMRVKSPHGWPGAVRLGETVAACGLGCGLALLAAAAAGRPGARRPAARPRTAAPPPFGEHVAARQRAEFRGQAGRATQPGYRQPSRSRRPVGPFCPCAGPACAGSGPARIHLGRRQPGRLAA